MTVMQDRVEASSDRPAALEQPHVRVVPRAASIATRSGAQGEGQEFDFPEPRSEPEPVMASPSVILVNVASPSNFSTRLPVRHPIGGSGQLANPGVAGIGTRLERPHVGGWERSAEFPGSWEPEPVVGGPRGIPVNVAGPSDFSTGGLARRPIDGSEQLANPEVAGMGTM